MIELIRSLFGYSNDRARPRINYTPNLGRIRLDLAAKFSPLDCDASTKAFLASARCPSWWRAILSIALQRFMSRTSANGLVGRGTMFVLSEAQCNKLIGAGVPRGNLIDIGAGDGSVTATISRAFRHVYATESSLPMQWRLWWRGFHLVQGPLSPSPRKYDVVCCLNVLDRVNKPLGLLRTLRELAAPGGVVLLAVVLPWCPFVECGPVKRPPEELLPMEGGLCSKGARWEESFNTLVTNVLEPSGFEVVTWSMVPYLCEGSPSHEYYNLDDAIFVLRAKDEKKQHRYILCVPDRFIVQSICHTGCFVLASVVWSTYIYLG